METAGQATVAVYRTHQEAEEAVRTLQRAGIPMESISIVGKNWQVTEDVQGYDRPSDAAAEGAREGAWVGGLFGLLFGFGFFLVPVVGPLFILGPLAGLVAGGIAGAGVGALISALVAMGIPKDQALKYQSRLQAGEFVLVVHGAPDVIARAQQVLSATGATEVQVHSAAA